MWDFFKASDILECSVSHTTEILFLKKSKKIEDLRTHGYRVARFSRFFFFFKCPRDFPGSPVVKTAPSNVGRVGSILCQGAKISHALQTKSQNTKQK